MTLLVVVLCFISVAFAGLAGWSVELLKEAGERNAYLSMMQAQAEFVAAHYRDGLEMVREALRAPGRSPPDVLADVAEIVEGRLGGGEGE